MQQSAGSLGPSAKTWLRSVGIDSGALARGEPAARLALREAAGELAADILRQAAGRHEYQRFSHFAHTDLARRQKISVLQGLATALLSAIQRESRNIVSIVEHRRAASPTGSRPTSLAAHRRSMSASVD